MGQAAVVMNDSIKGQCMSHQMSTPSGPTPCPPLPFDAPITQGCATSVLIGNQAAAVQGSSGMNTPPHNANVPTLIPGGPEQGRILVGSSTVLFEKKGAAYTGCSTATCMSVPGSVVGSASSVLIGP